MATFRYVTYEVLETFKSVFDDTKIQVTHALFWVQVAANRLGRQHLIENPDSGLFLTIFDNVAVVKDAALKDRQYIELPAPIFDFDNTEGVEYITYNTESLDCCSGPDFAQVQFTPTTPQNARRLSFNSFEEPSTTNPYFYRVGSRLYFLGTECLNVSNVEIGLKTSIDTSLQCGLDDEIPLPPDLIPLLILEVRNIGKLSLILPQERVNEGDDRTTERLEDERVAIQPQQSVIPNQQPNQQ